MKGIAPWSDGLGADGGGADKDGAAALLEPLVPPLPAFVPAYGWNYVIQRACLPTMPQNRHIPDVVPSEVRGVGFLLARAAAVLACSKASLSFSFSLFLRPSRGIPVFAENGLCTAGSVRRVRIVDRDRAKSSGDDPLGRAFFSWHETPYRVNSSLLRLLL